MPVASKTILQKWSKNKTILDQPTQRKFVTSPSTLQEILNGGFQDGRTPEGNLIHINKKYE